MSKAIIYIHGKGRNAKEALHYQPLFKDYEIIGFDYTAQFPWEAKEEFPKFFETVHQKFESVSVIANSIGAYFTMSALSDKPIEKAFFISPIVDMEKLIETMMLWANVTKEKLQMKKEIPTNFGEILSWEYYCYVKENPIIWKIPTYILYGEKDNLTSYETISDFANRIHAKLTVMKNGEHWFHTEEQMQFLDNWIKNNMEVYL